MAKSMYSNAPIAPSRVGALRALRLWRQGRQDSIKYLDAQDYSRTHALIQAQSHCRAGQHEVNQWLLRSVEPLISGNLRIDAELKRLDNAVLEIEALGSTSQRELSRSRVKRESILASRADSAAQREVNRSIGSTLMLAAAEALDSWESYYQLLAGVYERAKTRRTKGPAPSSQSSVPVFDGIQLAQVSYFDENVISLGQGKRDRN